ncbi:MAG: type II toxin-antitoxin system MqsA family antitoxin [Gammaproteobacteria bacterium]
MKCVICKHGETRPGVASVTLERGKTTIVIRDVPAEICQNCGEAYHAEAVTETVLRQAEEAVRAGVEFDVRRYTQAA